MLEIRSRRKSFFAAAMLLAATASCSEIAGGLPPEPGAVLFEVEYVNFAWAPTWFGFHVDRDGGVYRYRVDSPSPLAHGGDTYTEEELRLKYNHNPSLLRTLPPAEVLERYEQVGGALDGPLSEPRGVCADAGGLRFSALVYDAATARYRRVLLRQVGDVAHANLSAQARALHAWLKQLDPEFAGYNSCDPFAG